MQKYNIPGASIVVIKDFKVKWAKGFGYRNKKHKMPVTVDTLFQAASISKPITAVAVVEAFQTKDISLDKNVNEILSNWQIPKSNYTLKHPVTMRLLLAHSAGITGFSYNGYTIKDKLPTLLQSLEGVTPANTPPVTVVRKPGEKYEYSPAGYTIIQQALTDIYKKPYAEVMQDLILNPLQMTHSTFEEPLPKNKLDQIALPYLPNGELMPNSPLIFVESAAGGLWSTPTDLAKFVIAIQKTIVGKSQLDVSSNMMNEMMQPVVDHNMGLGFEVNINKYGEQTKKDADYFRHGGFNSGYLSMFVASKTTGNGVIIMANSAPYMDAKSVPQYDFIASTIKHISIVEKWK